jgi:hypothetical protein
VAGRHEFPVPQRQPRVERLAQQGAQLLRPVRLAARPNDADFGQYSGDGPQGVAAVRDQGEGVADAAGGIEVEIEDRAPAGLPEVVVEGQAVGQRRGALGDQGVRLRINGR